MRSSFAARSGKIIAAAFLAASLSAQPAAAGSATSSITVTATVLTACLITSSALAFGNYDPTSSTATTGSTSIIATCTLSAPYTIALGNGAGSGALASAGASGRKMTIALGSTTLGYNLYQDPAYATAWGNTAGLTQAGTGNGLAQSYTVYGRIPATQTASPGVYTDTVVATLTF